MKAADHMQGLQHGELRRLLEYFPTTGLFVWKVNIGKAKKGAVAGKRHPRGYIWIGIHGFHYLAHRLAWFYVNGVWPKDEMDHANMMKSDNRFCNLREATKSENMRNTKARRDSTSGFKGAKLDRRDGKYDAAIRVNGRSYHLGRFETAEEANRAYAVAAKKMHDEFARAA